MNRRLVACVSPVALLASALLLHCSSSSSTGTPKQDGGAGKDSSTTGHDSGTGKPDTGSTKKDSGTGGSHDAGIDTGSTTTHDAVMDCGFMFNPDAACVAISGGSACDPGNVECNGSMCGVPANECCLGGGADASDICLAADAACGGDAAGIPEACNETRDCADGQICCLSVYSISPQKAKTACQTFGSSRVCNDPAALLQAQICKADDECASGKCVRYDCMGTTIVSCANPYPVLCTAM